MKGSVICILAVVISASAMFGQTAASPGGGLKVAVVDMKRVFEAHPATAGAEERVAKSREEARDAFRDKTNALKEVLQQHQETIMAMEKASSGDADAKRAEAAALLKRARELEREAAEYKAVQEAGLKKSFLEEKNKITSAIVTAVKEYNSDGKYHLIVDTSAAGANGLPMIVDVRGLDDVTGEIIGLLK